MKQRFLILLVFTVLGLGIANVALRAAPVPILNDPEKAATLAKGPDQSLSECVSEAQGNCSIQHILLLANSIIKWAVAISGSIALLMYVLGGVWMIFSQGNSGRIERGKDIIVGTSVSLIFILGGWLIIQFALQSLGARPEYQLTTTTCGTNPDCPATQRCDPKTHQCVELCKLEKADQDPDHPWQCLPFGECGIISIENCSDPNCARNLCLSKPVDVVCCYLPQ